MPGAPNAAAAMAVRPPGVQQDGRMHALRTIWSGWPLTRRVVVASAAALALLLGLGLLGFSWALDRVLTQDAVSQSEAKISQLTTLVTTSDVTLQEAVTTLPAQGSQLQVLDSAGRVVAASDGLARLRFLPKPLAPGAETVTKTDFVVPDRTFVIVARGITVGGSSYTLVVARPLDIESKAVSTANIIVAIGSLILGSGLLFAMSRIVSQALKPVERIRSDVSRINAAGATERVTVPGGSDEIARLAETMNEMLARLAQSDAAMRQFVSDASHELRSPLATLRTHLETAPRDEAGQVTLDGTLTRGEVLRLQALVEDLLTLAKADDQGVPLTIEEVDLDDIVDVEVRRLRATVNRPVRAHIEPAQVLGDGGRLAQTLRNLVDNAVRHTTGGVWVLMETSRPGWVSVHVDNDGDPIPIAERERVFERFARLDSARARDRGGSGLGLAIARTFAEAHGGTVTTTRSPEGRCRFTLTLPTIG